MKSRYTVRKSPRNKFYWATWDSVEGRIAREYRDKESAQQLAKMLNKRERKPA